MNSWRRRGSLIAAFAALLAGCTDWNAFSKDYEGPGVCPAYVVAGDTHTCVRKSNGTGVCFGDNRFGQLGTGDTSPHDGLVRVPVANVSKVYVPMGDGNITADLASFTCAITTDNALQCWGDNRWNAFDTGHDREPSPVAIAAPSGLVHASLGGGHICTLTTSGSVSCFGNNASGQVGVSAGSNVTKPTVVAGLVADKILTGASHTCAGRADGSLACWGANAFGQLGVADTNARSKPTEVTGVAGGASGISTGAGHTCAQTPAGDLYCWGDNRYGQLGLGDRTNRLQPTQVTFPGKAGQISAGGSHTCAVHTDGSLFCWGDNRSGQLGVGDVEPRTAPTKVDALGTSVVVVYAGGAHTCALRADGSVSCWGNNQYGQVGSGLGLQALTPVQVLAPCH